MAGRGPHRTDTRSRRFPPGGERGYLQKDPQERFSIAGSREREKRHEGGLGLVTAAEDMPKTSEDAQQNYLGTFGKVGHLGDEKEVEIEL